MPTGPLPLSTPKNVRNPAAPSHGLVDFQWISLDLNFGASRSNLDRVDHQFLLGSANYSIPQ